MKSLKDAFGIFHNNIKYCCLFKLRRVCYQATEYAILLHNYTHAFSTEIESGGHSYCCDFVVKNYFQPLILPDFLMMETIQEVVTRQCQR